MKPIRLFTRFNRPTVLLIAGLFCWGLAVAGLLLLADRNRGYAYDGSPASECRLVARYSVEKHQAGANPILADRSARALDCSQAFSEAGVKPSHSPFPHANYGRVETFQKHPDEVRLPVTYPCIGLCGEGGYVPFHRHGGHWHPGKFVSLWAG